MDQLLKSKLEHIVGESILIKTTITGGDISNASLVRTKSGNSYFLKEGISGEMFFREAEGLKELLRPRCICVPKVMGVGDDFLLLEYVNPGRKGNHFFDDFGQALAQMHRFSGHQFGYMSDNYIGFTQQLNLAQGAERQDWGLFFWNKRLLFQYQLCERNKYADSVMRRLFALLESLYPRLMAGSEEPPALLHGDLWCGNFLCNCSGEPVLVDPAVYYGHREADLAMTKLFGGFPPSFYEAYKCAFPLKEGAEEREPLYLLYHVLNHLNMFGSGYYGMAVDLLKRATHFHN